HGNRHRDAARGERGKHQLVATYQPLLAELEAAEAVVLVRVRPGEVEDELGARTLERLVQAALEMPQVFVVARAVGELDVEAVPLPWCTSQSTMAMRCRPASTCMARAAMAASLKTQKPSPRSRKAWWVPPARLADQPHASASRAAASVAPEERR